MKILTALLPATLLLLAGCGAPLDDAMVEQRAIQDGVNHCSAKRELWMQGGVEINVSDIVVSGHCIPIWSREDMEAAAARIKNATTSEFPNYTLVTTSDRRTQYYFTKPSDKLYPWAVGIFIAGSNATPGANNDNPIGVRGSLALPRATPAPATPERAQAVLTWANGWLASVKTEFRITTPAATVAPARPSAGKN
jgi:hypothetical protein